MKTLYTTFAILLFSSFAFGQSSVAINGADDHVDYASDSVYISGDGINISKLFYVVNTGSSTEFFWSRTIVSRSSSDFIVQLCDENICMDTQGLYWIGPEKTILTGDSLMFKPQMTLSGVSGTAEVKYYALDGNQEKIDSVTVFFTSTVSTQKQEELKFSLYPNPTQNRVTISGEAIKNGGTVVFLDALGKEVKRAEISATNNQIDVTSLKRGVYFVNILNQNGTKTTVQRLIKQ